MPTNKLIILGREGVINERSVDLIASPGEWIPIPGSLEAIAQLNQADYRVVVITNQDGLAQGRFTIDTLNAIHNKMSQALAAEGGRVDGLFFCPHGADSDCDCRSPSPGLLNQVAERFHVCLEQVRCVGDSLEDLQAAMAADAQPILVRTGRGEQTETDPRLDPTIPVYNSLSDLVATLVQQEE